MRGNTHTKNIMYTRKTHKLHKFTQISHEEYTYLTIHQPYDWCMITRMAIRK